MRYRMQTGRGWNRTMQRSQRLIKQWKHKYTDCVSLWARTCVFSSEGERVFLRMDSSVGGGRDGAEQSGSFREHGLSGLSWRVYERRKVFAWKRLCSWNRDKETDEGRASIDKKLSIVFSFPYFFFFKSTINIES